MKEASYNSNCIHSANIYSGDDCTWVFGERWPQGLPHKE